MQLHHQQLFHLPAMSRLLEAQQQRQRLKASSAPPASSSEPATSGADAANDHTPSSSTSASGNR